MFEFINFNFAVIAIVMGLAGFVVSVSFLPDSTYKRLALPTFLLGVAFIIVGFIALTNATTASRQESVHRTILEEANLPAPLLVDQIVMTDTKIYRINDTKISAGITLIERGRDSQKYYDFTVETYGKPGNVSDDWVKIGKTIIPKTKKKFPPIWRSMTKNGTLVFKIMGPWGPEYTYIKPWA